MPYFVYMLASRKGGTIYTGMTGNIAQRTFEHRESRGGNFTSKHSIKRLVWYEQHELALDAIQREKNIKHYYRKWKIDLIESINPEWNDLYKTLNS